MKLGKTLRSQRGAESIADLAKRLGVNKNTLGDYERGMRLPDVVFLMQFAAETGADRQRLVELLVEDSMQQAGVIDDDFKSLRGIAETGVLTARETTKLAYDAGFRLVPELNVTASAGAGQINAEERVVGTFAFRDDWLRRRGLTMDALGVVRARGDSMQDTIYDGDILLVDKNVDSVRLEGIYLLERAGELLCKRLQPLIGGGVVIRSDNRRYEPQSLDTQEAEHLHVKGKVVWVGGER